MAKFQRFALTLLFVGGTTVSFAADYLFLNPPYLSETRLVVSEAKEKSAEIFKNDAELLKNFDVFCKTLDGIVVDKQQKQALKKVKADDLEQTKDAEFAKALNDFKDGLNAMADIAGLPLAKLIVSYDRWNRLETAVVKRGLEERLAAYDTRFGAQSEQINILEFLVSQKFLAGDESGPSAWEPIFRVTPVQITSSGEGLTSTAQLGMNYYFVKEKAPKVLQWLGAENHFGMAASVQYLNEPGVFNAKGKPSYGVIFHLGRKEAGVSWDDEQDRVQVTLGYAFQFIPLAL